MDALFHWTGMVVWLGVSLAFGLFCIGLVAEFLGDYMRHRSDGEEDGGTPYL